MRKVVDIIQEALDVPASEITNVHALGGMTNINYHASVGNEHYIVRIPGVGTSQFINRKEEEKNLDIGVQLGINPEHICIDAETGLKITRMIPGAITLTSVRHERKRNDEKNNGCATDFTSFGCSNG